MNQLKSLFSKTLAGHLWNEFQLRYYFKYVLPRMNEISLEGLRFDVSKLPPLGRNRLLNGGYEAHEKEMCRQYLEPHDSVLEIGGAIGFIGLFCQKKIGIKNYYIIEANPRTIDALRMNYRLNGLEAKVWNYALAQQECRVELEVGGNFWENSIIGRRQPGLERVTIAVPGSPFPVLLERMPSRVNTLIIDVEGAEQYIDFSQMPDDINKIIIELHPQIIGPEETYNIVAQLVRKGFRVVREIDKTFAFLRKAEATIDAASSRYSEGTSGGGFSQDGFERHASAAFVAG